MLTGTRLAVWGDPISHSLSPRLHAAAYRALGLDWEYTRRRVDAEGFAAALSERDASWRGLSLTMPLKGVAAAAAATRDRHAELTGAVNTLLLGAPGAPRGFNTDVGGLVRTLTEHGTPTIASARIIGAGATATSALVALAEVGAQEVEVRARRLEAAEPLRGLGDRLGVSVHVAELTAPASEVDVTISTLPGGTDPGPAAHSWAGTGGDLFDVVYGEWPTPLAQAWARAGASAHSGLGMLLHQALLQVRVFATGEPDAALPHEDAVLAAMRDALVGD